MKSVSQFLRASSARSMSSSLILLSVCWWLLAAETAASAVTVRSSAISPSTSLSVSVCWNSWHHIFNHSNYVNNPFHDYINKAKKRPIKSLLKLIGVSSYLRYWRVSVAGVMTHLTIAEELELVTCSTGEACVRSVVDGVTGDWGWHVTSWHVSLTHVDIIHMERRHWSRPSNIQ